MTRLPSIGARLARALLGSALLWSAAVSLTVWTTVRHEMLEMLDDTLQGTAEALAVTLAATLPGGAEAALEGGAETALQAGAEPTPPAGPAASGRFAWQVVASGPDGRARVLLASTRAPAEPFRATPSAGFGDLADWRVFGAALGGAGQMLYVAQSTDERVEAALDVAFSAALATLAVALLAHLWLRAWTARELEPLQRLSERLAGHDLLAPDATLGTAERAELAPVHEAIDSLAAQLLRRVAHERAFTAHAAHALRTPLAGIDAQLANALREAPPELQPRLQRVRAAAGRLQRVVAALLALFRSGVDLQRRPLDLGALLARLPVEGLAVELQATQPLHADADLVSAALINLLDNAVRHGAHAATVSTPAPDVLRVQDDGPGVPEARRRALQQALDTQAYEGRTGLGLMLAGMVARAHGGAIVLPPAARGFAVEMHLGGRRDPGAGTTNGNPT